MSEKWTIEEDAILTRMAREGYSATRISEVIGRSGKAVSQRAERISVQLMGFRWSGVTPSQRVAPNPWTPEDDATLTRLAGEGLTSAKIAEALGRTRNSVIGRAVRKGVKIGATYTGTMNLIRKKRIRSRKKPEVSKISAVETVSLSGHISTAPEPDFAPQTPFLLDGVAFTTQSIPFGRCRWIDDAEATADSPMCGHEVYADGKPWCSHHRMRATIIVAPRKDPVQEAMRRWG